MCRNTAFGPLRRPGRVPGMRALRHSDLGLRMTTVSSMESGAGSVEVSARPALPSTCSTSGNCLMIRSVTWSNLLRFGDGDAGHGGRHVEDGPFFQGRHELRAQFEVDRNRGDHQGEGSRDHHPLPAQGPGRDRVVDPDQETADGVFVLGSEWCPRRTALVARHSQAGPEAEILHVGKEQPQGRVQGDRQDGGDDHGQVLGVGQGLEQAAFLRPPG